MKRKRERQDFQFKKSNPVLNKIKLLEYQMFEPTVVLGAGIVSNCPRMWDSSWDRRIVGVVN